MQLFASRYFYLIISALIFCLDRISKMLALYGLVHERYVLIPGFAAFQLSFNTGISFSLFASAGETSHWLLTAVIAVLVCAIFAVWHYFSSGTTLSEYAYALIVGGAIGNFYDRLVCGRVIDFIDIYYQTWHFPTFNVADMAIFCGFVLLVVDIIWGSE